MTMINKSDLIRQSSKQPYRNLSLREATEKGTNVVFQLEDNDLLVGESVHIESSLSNVLDDIIRECLEGLSRDDIPCEEIGRAHV